MTTRLFGFDEIVLPAGERLIWQGRPAAKSLALRVFHVRLVVGYFGLLFAARLAVNAFEQQPWDGVFASASRLAIPLTIALVLLGGLSLLYSRTTRYSLTSRRVLIQFGAVLSMTLNIPLGQVASAGLRKYKDGTGDLPLTVSSDQRLAFLLLWPHVRPWRLSRVEPMLRCVPDASRFAEVLAQALRAAVPQASEPVVAALAAPQSKERTAPIATAA
jgi:hypothetical protein